MELQQQSAARCAPFTLVVKTRRRVQAGRARRRQRETPWPDRRQPLQRAAPVGRCGDTRLRPRAGLRVFLSCAVLPIVKASSTLRSSSRGATQIAANTPVPASASDLIDRIEQTNELMKRTVTGLPSVTANSCEVPVLICA
jgi:hypothetical protein